MYLGIKYVDLSFKSFGYIYEKYTFLETTILCDSENIYIS